MYQVITLYGDFEPWWFLEGWQDDITESQTFEELEQAEQYYQKQCLLFAQQFPNQKEQFDTMTAFWNEDDTRWCEECDEYLQQYKSVLILPEAEVMRHRKKKQPTAVCTVKRRTKDDLEEV